MPGKTSVQVGDIPAEAAMKGGLNESTPAEQRAPVRADIAMSDGPRMGEKGEYLPATYALPESGLIRTDR